MSKKGQPTRLAERVEIGERWQAKQTDRQIALALERPLTTVRKWRRRYQQEGRSGLWHTLGRPASGALGHFPAEMSDAITELRKAHPG